MKHYIDALVMIGIIGLFTTNGYGAEPMRETLDKGIDPTAALLVEQGINQREAGQPEAALTSFKLASQIDPKVSIPVDPKLSIPAFNTGRAGSGAARRGFAEFGIASLLGFMFVLAMAAYDIGVTHPFMEARRELLRKEIPFGVKQWPVAA